MPALLANPLRFVEKESRQPDPFRPPVAMTMNLDHSEPTVPAPPANGQSKRPLHQAVTGVTAPQLGEARIREVRPSVTAWPASAALGKRLLELPSAIAGMLPPVPIVTVVLWPIVGTAL